MKSRVVIFSLFFFPFSFSVSFMIFLCFCSDRNRQNFCGAPIPTLRKKWFFFLSLDRKRGVKGNVLLTVIEKVAVSYWSSFTSGTGRRTSNIESNAKRSLLYGKINTCWRSKNGMKSEFYIAPIEVTSCTGKGKKKIKFYSVKTRLYFLLFWEKMFFF